MTSSTPKLFDDKISSSEVILQIGGGTQANGWMNLDPAHGTGRWRRYAQDVPWPVVDNSVDLILASHVMEHIPAGQERIDVMNEAHRVLKPEGLLAIVVPLLCNESTGLVNFPAVADPTHVSYWMMSSFSYFDGTQTACADYGILRWKTLSWDTERFHWEGRWVGTPVK